MTRVVAPFRGEFGLTLYWHAPAVHAIEGPKIVMIEGGREALYPSASSYLLVPRQVDGKRRNRYDRDKEFLGFAESLARHQLRENPEMLYPDTKWPRKYFRPEPYEAQAVDECDVVICPRRRMYGSEKNWPEWWDLCERLKSAGVRVFAAGAQESSYQVRCPAAWDYPRDIDATIEAMNAAKLVVATDAGLAALAVLLGRPLYMVTHDDTVIAPGPVIDETGAHLEDRYWPVKMHRYDEMNHLDSAIKILDGGWYRPDMVLDHILRALK